MLTPHKAVMKPTEGRALTVARMAGGGRRVSAAKKMVRCCVRMAVLIADKYNEALAITLAFGLCWGAGRC